MRRLSLACLLVLSLALPAFAEDAPAPAKPKTDDFAALVAKWPAPSEESAFRFEGVLMMGEHRMGTFTLAVGPAMTDGKLVGWEAREVMTLDFQGTKARGETTYRFTRDLRQLGGVAEENFEGPDRFVWTAKEGKVHITRTQGEAEPTTVVVANDALALSGKAGLFMLARFAPLASAAYRGTSFSGQDEDGAVTTFQAEVDPAARHEGSKVLSVSGLRRNERIQLLVDPESRDILKVVLTKTDDAMVLAIVPKGAAPEATPAAGEDLFSREARTAEEGSAQILYALTVKDRDAIEKGFRWSTMYAFVKKQLEDAGQTEIPSFEDWQSATFEGMAAGTAPESVTPEQLRAGLLAVLPQVKVQDTPEGYKAVFYPESFKQLLVIMEKQDDGWKAVGVRQLGK